MNPPNNNSNISNNIPYAYPLNNLQPNISNYNPQYKGYETLDDEKIARDLDHELNSQDTNNTPNPPNPPNSPNPPEIIVIDRRYNDDSITAGCVGGAMAALLCCNVM